MAARATEGDEQDSPGFMEQVMQFLEEDRGKWGGMTAGAMGRLGLAELREAVSLDSGNEASTPYGMYGVLAPGEVSAMREQGVQAADDRSMDMTSMLPGDIAFDRGAFGAEQSATNDRETASMAPGDIAQDSSIYTPDQDLGRSQDASRGR